MTDGAEKPEEDENLLKLSASQLSTFKTCPRQWKFEYVDKIRGPATLAQVVGSFAHEVLENFYLLPPEQRTEDNAKYLARVIWDKMITDPDKYPEFASLELDEPDQKKFRVAAWKGVKGIWKLEDPKEIDVIETERGFSLEFDGALLRGYIDRVSRDGNGIVIDDYKTGKPPQKRYQADKLNQVYLYALAASMLYDEPVVAAGLLFLGREILKVDITEEQIRKTRTKLLKAIKVVTAARENEEYPAKPQPLCGWCPHILLCPEGQEFMKEYAVRRPDAPNAILLGPG